MYNWMFVGALEIQVNEYESIHKIYNIKYTENIALGVWS